MKKLFSGLLACVLLWPMGHAFAGVKGYKVVFIDLTPSEQFKPIFMQYRKTITPQTTSRCWMARKGDWIEIAYVKKQPIDIAPESMRLAAVGDNVSIRKFSALLGQYKDDEITSGFDGAYLIEEKDDQYAVVGISRDGSFVKSLPFRSKSIKALDQGLCVAAAAFDKAFDP